MFKLKCIKELAKKGYRVIVHGRDSARIKAACKEVKAVAQHSADAIPALADLSSIEGCESLASIVEEKCPGHLDLIINNAGIFSDGNGRKVVGEHDLEETFAVNVLAPFVVTSLLLPLLTVNDGTRILVVSSISQSYQIDDWDDLQFERRPYSAHRSYSESKLLDAMLCFEMSDRLKASGFDTSRVTCNTLDPGTVNTKMLLAGWGACGIPVKRALDQTWLATSDEVEGVTGQYYVGRYNRKAASCAYDAGTRSKLWDILSGLAPDAAAMWKKL